MTAVALRCRESRPGSYKKHSKKTHKARYFANIFKFISPGSFLIASLSVFPSIHVVCEACISLRRLFLAAQWTVTHMRSVICTTQDLLPMYIDPRTGET